MTALNANGGTPKAPCPLGLEGGSFICVARGRSLTVDLDYD